MSHQPDADRQAKARQYAAINRRLWLGELFLGGAFLLLLIVSGLATTMRDLLLTVTTSQPLLVAIALLLLALCYGLLSAPITYYSSFHLAHRFGLSMQTLRAWLWDLLKGALIGGILGLIVVEVVYFLIGRYPEIWWLLAAIVMLLFTVVLSNLSPILLLPLFYKLTPLDDEDIAHRLTRIAEAAGARVQGVYKMNMSSKTTAANAALMGLGNTRRIVLGDTLLAQYDPDEIETVLAHELAHHVHRDIPKGIAVQSILTLATFYLIHLTLGIAVPRFGYHGTVDVAAMPLIGLVVGVFGVLAMPLANGFSRHIEQQADRYALHSTGKREAFARAMIKLADQNLSEFAPPRWVEILFYDHPAAWRRVQLSEERL